MEDVKDCLFHLKTTQGTKLKNLFETAAPLLDDVNFECTPEGLRFTSYTGQNVMLIDAELRADKTEEFFCSSHVTIGVNLGHVYLCLKTIGQTSVVTFQYLKPELNHGRLFHIGIDNSDGVIIVFAVKTMILNDTLVTLPEKEFEAGLAIYAEKFQYMVKTAHRVGDCIQINSVFQQHDDENYHFVNFITQSTFNSKSAAVPARPIQCEDLPKRFTLQKNTSHICAKTELYKLKTLMVITKATNMCKKVEVYLAKNYPLVLRYEVGTLGHFTVCLVHEETTPGEVQLMRTKDPDAVNVFEKRLNSHVGRSVKRPAFEYPLPSASSSSGQIEQTHTQEPPKIDHSMTLPLEEPHPNENLEKKKRRRRPNPNTRTTKRNHLQAKLFFASKSPETSPCST